VELVRSIFADWERGDFGSAEWAHPDIEFVIADGPAPESSRGVASMAVLFGDYLSAWQKGSRPVAGEYRELDDERVLVLHQVRGRGKTSGISLEEMARAATVFHIGDGRVTRLVFYLAGDRALADLGLAPEVD
jgi:ketosteroid isomerase-like protein